MKKRTLLVPALSLATCGFLSACSKGNDDVPINQRTAALGSTATARFSSRPAWATSPRLLGRVDANQRISVQVHLAMRNEKAAEAELLAISNPTHPHYRQYLSDAEYLAKYAPTPEDVAAVRAHLEQHGLSIQHIPRNLTYIAAEGTAAQMEAAFNTHLGRYQVGSAVRNAPIEEVALPSAISSRVSSVMGLATVEFQPHYLRAGLQNKRVIAKGVAAKDDVPADTCSEWYGQIADKDDPPYPGYSALTYAPCGLVPSRVRAAYGFSKAVRGGTDGTGQSVAIVDAWLSPTLVQDAQTYAANHDPDYPLLSSQITTQWGPGTSQKPEVGWYTEQSLDVESVHAMAPGANIVYVGAQSNYDTDLIAAVNMIVADGLATIISNSYSQPEQGGGTNYVAWHSVATQAGLKGVGLYFSTGDGGDLADELGSPSAGFPASLDNVTAVGGTSLAVNNAGNVQWEAGWENGFSFLTTPPPPMVPDGGAAADMGSAAPYWTPKPPGFFAGGAGGGVSVVYDQPTWQAGVVPDGVAGSGGAPARAIPDVALLADPNTGMTIGFTDPSTNVYVEAQFGGTSLSTPLFAGTMALAQQGVKSKKPFGFANPALYKNRAAAFRDVTPLLFPQAVAFPGGVVLNFEYPNQTISTATGWDTVTGIGVPNGQSFLTTMGK